MKRTEWSVQKLQPQAIAVEAPTIEMMKMRARRLAKRERVLFFIRGLRKVESFLNSFDAAVVGAGFDVGGESVE